MSLQLDNSLGLIYKNMVGLSTIVVDTSGNTFMKQSMSVNSNLYASGFTILMGDTSLMSNLNVNGNFINNGNVSLNSSLNISGFTIINSSATLNNSLNVSGSAVINNSLNVLGNVTNQSNLNVQGLTVCNNGINTNNINAISPTLNILGNTINIGDGSSIININGTATYVASTDTLIIDKLISLNVNSSTLLGADNGMLSGIEILGTSSRGFIRTTNDASRFEIQAPLLNSPKNFITVQDVNNNLTISGNTNLIGSTTLNSNLVVNSSSLLNGDTTVNNSIYVSSNTLLNGPTIINSSLNVSGLTVINNNCSINSSLNINGISIHNSTVSMNSFVNISGNTIINGIITANNILNVNSNMINNNSVSINSSLNVSGLTIINGLTSITNSLNISGTTNIGSNLNINSNLVVTGNTIFNNNISLNSSLTVSGPTIFNNSISINSNLGIMGQIVAKLPNYSSNLDARNGGVPLWGFYRTGGIIKIRLNDTPPSVNLSGASTISVSIGATYTDPGVYSLDYNNNLIPVYMNLNNASNTLFSNFLITGISTIVPNVNSLSVGNYTATYSATDDSGLTGYIYRTLNINAIFPTGSLPTLTGLISDSQLTKQFVCIVYNSNNSLYYGFPQTNGNNLTSLRYFTSTDNINWTVNSYFVTNSGLTNTTASYFPAGANICTYGNGILLLVINYNNNSGRYNIIYKSTDGTTWQSLNGFTIQNAWIGVKFINNKYFITATYDGSNASELYHSTDTITWTKVFTSVTGQYQGVFSCSYADRLIYGNGYYVINGDSRSSNNIWSFIKSTDGINWTLSTIPTSITNSVKSPNDVALVGSMAFGNGMFVMANYSTYSTNKSFILNSTDLNNWNIVELPYINNDKTNYVNNGNRINYINSIFIFYLYGNFINIHGYSNGNGYLCTSPDGITWTYQNTILSLSYADYSATIANNKLFIPTFDNNKPFYLF